MRTITTKTKQDKIILNIQCYSQKECENLFKLLNHLDYKWKNDNSSLSLNEIYWSGFYKYITYKIWEDKTITYDVTPFYKEDNNNNNNNNNSEGEQINANKQAKAV